MGKIIELNTQRRYKPRTYDAPPQTGEETIDGVPLVLSVEEIVHNALDGDINCIEWLGHPLPASIFEAPKPRETHSECSVCHKVKLLEEFYRDSRKANGRYSMCKRCHSDVMKEQYNRGKFRRWGRAA